MYHVPSAVVTLVKTNPAPALVTLTFAPTTTAPVLSVTAPIMVAVPVDDCAARLTTTSAKESRRRSNMGPPFFGGNAIERKSHCQSGQQPLSSASVRKMAVKEPLRGWGGCSRQLRVRRYAGYHRVNDQKRLPNAGGCSRRMGARSRDRPVAARFRRRNRAGARPVRAVVWVMPWSDCEWGNARSKSHPERCGQARREWQSHRTGDPGRPPRSGDAACSTQRKSGERCRRVREVEGRGCRYPV